MKKTALTILAALALVSCAHAIPPKNVDIDSDFQQLQPLPDLGLQEGASARIHLRIKNDTRWADISGLTGRLEFRETASASTGIVANSTLTSNAAHFIRFDLGSAQTGTNFSDWVYSYILVDGAADYVLGTGRVDILESAFAGSGGVVVTTTVYATEAALTAETAARVAGDLALTNYVDAATNAIAVAGTPNLAAVLTQGNNAETQKIDNLLDVHFVPTNSTVSSTAGNVFFDEADDALSYRTSISDAIMQIGQEQWLRAKQSASAPTITNGVVVYIDGASGNRPTVDLADADLAAADEPVGFATHTFTANDGFVTIHGLVRDVDTSPYAAGDQLYLSSIPGGVTNVEPASGTVYHLGTVARSHATAGIIYANVERHWDNDIDAGDLAVSNWVVSANYLTVESDPLSLYTNGSVPMAASLNMGGQSITNLMDPTAAQDAATKAYVDTAATEADTLATVSARGNTYTGSLSVATSGADGLAIGTGATASGANSIAAGPIALAAGPNCIALGLTAGASGTNSVAIGNASSTSATHLNSVVLSAAAGGASSSGSGQLVLAADSLVRLVGADIQANSNAILKADLSSYAGDNVTWDATDYQFDASAAGGVSLPINFGVSKSVYSNVLTTSHYVGPYFSNSFEWLEIYTNGVLSHYRKTATGE